MSTTHFSNPFYNHLTHSALNDRALSRTEALRVLEDPNLELLPLLHAAFQVRKRHFGHNVRVQILNNVQNGYCPEDCNYCAQSTSSEAPIVKHRMKSDAEILADAEKAHEAGAFRHCLVLSGRGPGSGDVAHMAGLIAEMKRRWPMEICLSAGMIDREMADALKAVGLNRYNHNLNTAEGHYGAICNSHTYADRLATLEAARAAGLEVCSGLIIGMGESADDVVAVAETLRRLNARSIPVNFYVHVPGTKLGPMKQLTPQKCLRTLCLFRFMNPDAEIRAAGGREVHLRSLEALALYPANSLFSEGYLNTGGHATDRTVRMIEEAGFIVENTEEQG